MKYSVKNILNPTLYVPTEPDFEGVKTTLTMVQKGILYAKIKKLVDREKILEKYLKRAFTIIHVHCTEGFSANMEWDSKYVAINNYQDVI